MVEQVHRHSTHHERRGNVLSLRHQHAAISRVGRAVPRYSSPAGYDDRAGGASAWLQAKITISTGKPPAYQASSPSSAARNGCSGVDVAPGVGGDRSLPA